MRKKIKQGQKVEVSFSPRERVLVLEHTFTGPELTTALGRAQLESGQYVVRYTLDDLDELLGFVAAEANHSTDKKLRKELDALYNHSTCMWSGKRTVPSSGSTRFGWRRAAVLAGPRSGAWRRW